MDFIYDAGYFFANGASLFLDPVMLFLVLLGTVIGMVVGIIPGMTSTMGIAIFTPLTFGMTPEKAFVFLIGIYGGSLYAGSITSILVNIPGTPGAIATGFDGHPLAMKGEAGRAIGISATSSMLGGMIGILVLALAAPSLAKVALKFRNEEYVAMTFLGLSVVSYISGASLAKGMIATLIGLFLASVGMDEVSGYPRFTFGLNDLGGGLELIPVLIGFFGVPEVLNNLSSREIRISQKITHVVPRPKDILKLTGPIIRGSGIGVFIGAVPAAGGSVAVMISYGIEKMLSRKPEEFGKGALPGLASPEASHNASMGGALIPMLTMGIPGDPMTAVLIGALMIHGLNPGPLLFKNHPQFISSILLGNTISTLMFWIIGMSFARIFVKVLAIPRNILMPSILFFCIMGSYVIRNSFFDVGVVVVFGVLAFLLQRIQIMPAPIILGLVLGPILEDNLRRALIMSNGSLLPFITRPVSLVLLIFSFLILISPVLRTRLRRRAT